MSTDLYRKFPLALPCMQNLPTITRRRAGRKHPHWVFELNGVVVRKSPNDYRAFVVVFEEDQWLFRSAHRSSLLAFTSANESAKWVPDRPVAVIALTEEVQS